MFKKIINLFLLILFTASCADTFSSVRRGLTGAKANSADEFLVKKKDPLILPPDFESLPAPGDKVATRDENLIFEKTLEETDEEVAADSSSNENAILRKIQRK